MIYDEKNELKFCPICDSEMHWTTFDRGCSNKGCNFREPHIHDVDLMANPFQFVCTCLRHQNEDEARKRREIMKRYTKKHGKETASDMFLYIKEFYSGYT